VGALDIAYLGGSITFGTDASDVNVTSWRALLSAWLTAHKPSNEFTYQNAGVGGTGSWYGLARLQADVIANNPGEVFIDFAVNDANLDGGGTHTNGYTSCAEALIRRLRTALPNAKLYCWIFTYPNNYSGITANYRAARDKWITLAAAYGLTLLRWDTYLESLMPPAYVDADVESYLTAPGNVHPNDAGHDAAFDLAVTEVASLTSNNPGALPARIYSECVDYEVTPIIRNGIDNDGETGTWSTSGTRRVSSEADATVHWTGDICGFGLDTLIGAGTGVVAWSLDGGAYTNRDLTAITTQSYIVTNFPKGVHTITLKVISGTVTIKRFLAI
jgi:lysophospholipase L1-like esterase